MDKRLAKRHKRQVARERQRVKLSEPDVRTPEQIKAAREASRSARGNSNVGAHVGNSTPAARTVVQNSGSAAKTDG
jgi:hypothetical protein